MAADRLSQQLRVERERDEREREKMKERLKKKGRELKADYLVSLWLLWGLKRGGGEWMR